MGITGDHERLDAATISDTVNTASRLEGLTKHYKVNILLSEASVNSLVNPEAFHFSKLGWIQLKGKLAPVSIYECFNSSDGHLLQSKLSALPHYTEAVAEYYNKSFVTASDKFHLALSIDRTRPQLFLRKEKPAKTTFRPFPTTGQAWRRCIVNAVHARPYRAVRSGEAQCSAKTLLSTLILILSNCLPELIANHEICCLQPSPGVTSF